MTRLFLPRHRSAESHVHLRQRRMWPVRIRSLWSVGSDEIALAAWSSWCGLVA
jgi:hypothetical protein